MKYSQITISLAVFMFALVVSATPAYAALPKASNGEGASQQINLAGTDAQILSRANEAIDHRIESLQDLKERISEMKRLSDATETSLTTIITNEIAVLQAFKAKIATETGATLKADVKTITSGFRVYMLVMPQIRLLSAADRATQIADSLATLAGKLQVRITTLQSSGVDVAALNASLSDMNAKIAEAKTAASAATTLLTGLKPDQKDKSVMDANQKTITDARAKVKAAETALKAARSDAQDIAKTLKEDRKESKEKKEDKRGESEKGKRQGDDN